MKLHLALLFSALLLFAQAGQAEEQVEQLPVRGRLFLPDGSSFANTHVVLQLESGRRLIAFPLHDGAFAFSEVPTGVHTLTIESRGLLFPTLRMDVGASRKGKVVAAAVEAPGAPVVPYPLTLRPFSRIEYFDRRQGFNFWAFMKTPYGMMAGFMLFSIFIMPKLKIDPEDYKEITGQLSGQQNSAPAASGGGGGSQQRRRAD